jgi:hypothetical protein
MGTIPEITVLCAASRSIRAHMFSKALRKKPALPPASAILQLLFSGLIRLHGLSLMIWLALLRLSVFLVRLTGLLLRIFLVRLTRLLLLLRVLLIRLTGLLLLRVLLIRLTGLLLRILRVRLLVLLVAHDVYSLPLRS